MERPGIVDGCFDATLSQLIPKLFTPLFPLFSGKENRVLVVGVLHPVRHMGRRDTLHFPQTLVEKARILPTTADQGVQSLELAQSQGRLHIGHPIIKS